MRKKILFTILILLPILAFSQKSVIIKSDTTKAILHRCFIPKGQWVYYFKYDSVSKKQPYVAYTHMDSIFSYKENDSSNVRCVDVIGYVVSRTSYLELSENKLTRDQWKKIIDSSYRDESIKYLDITKKKEYNDVYDYYYILQ